MKELQQRVTLSKAHRSTTEGAELLALLTELSSDGQVTREEMERLRHWLEVDRGIDFPACAFLYGVMEPIASDGVITEEELDGLALAIERVLPTDVRAAAATQRKQHRAARRRDQALNRAADRSREREARAEARERARPLHRADFMVMGAVRSAERREGCEGLDVGDVVTLEREPDNRHDANAILVLTSDGTELGYVPRSEASEMAPLLDGGAAQEAIVKRLLSTADGYVIPIVVSRLLRDAAAQEVVSPRGPAISAVTTPPPAVDQESVPLLRQSASGSSPATQPPVADRSKSSPSGWKMAALLGSVGVILAAARSCAT